ncbi:peptidoglycan DD-metalloendopeptidase family protein [Pandoraea terrae]|nr:peptidoglycan DD-metalloendopeptidase family protein [Pandoraea terrae]
MLAACASRQVGAPVVDRTMTPGTSVSGSVVGAAPVVDDTPVPPGFYRVKPGDRLYRIALENGQNYRDIARWNNIANPDQIEVGQVLRVKPPAGDTATPLPQAAPVAGAAASGANGATANNPAAAPAQANPAASAPAASGGALSLGWPARGSVVGTFNDSTNKGLNISGSAGDPVVAAGAGKVVYSGAGLRGYGNLVIIKHDGTFLTAYAHNRTLLVKEGDSVTRGQKIAEMGDSDASRVMLHFEVRRDGKPVDPMKYLPPQ